MHKRGKRCRRGRKGLSARIYMSEIHGECVEGHAPRKGIAKHDVSVGI